MDSCVIRPNSARQLAFLRRHGSFAQASLERHLARVIATTVLRSSSLATFAGRLPSTLGVVVWLGLSACGSQGSERGSDQHVVRLDRSDLPLVRATPIEVERFDAGDALFETTLREADGLGPLYMRSTCIACHVDDARGPGVVTRLGVVGIPERLEVTRDSLLPFGDAERPYVAAGAVQPLLVAPSSSIKRSTRLPPAVFGRGYMEAVDDAEIERLARDAASRNGPIRGEIHRVSYQSEANPDSPFHAHGPGTTNLIGRFGLKARIATLDEFTADALQGDMGLTSPLRPHELPNPDGLTDDEKPGVDLDVESVNLISDYVRLLEIPERRWPTAPDAATESELQRADQLGAALFEQVQCAVCHVPTLRTRRDYPIASLADIDAPVYTDFLLHDMGEGLDDGVQEGNASGRQWRTAPLIGLRFFSGFMHDGRAKSIEAAVRAHASEGSEANQSVQEFDALSATERSALIGFVSQL